MWEPHHLDGFWDGGTWRNQPVGSPHLREMPDGPGGMIVDEHGHNHGHPMVIDGDEVQVKKQTPQVLFLVPGRYEKPTLLDWFFEVPRSCKMWHKTAYSVGLT